MKNKYSCEIIRDLLVSYMDETCSEESRHVVESHLEECASCKNELNNYKSDIDKHISTEETISTAKPFKRIKRRIRVLAITLCVLVLLGIPVVIYGIYGYNYSFFEADKKLFSVSDKDFLKDEDLCSYVVDNIRRTYPKIYYDLRERRGDSIYDSDVSELLKEYNMIHDVQIDYENITCVNDEFIDTTSNTVLIDIPLITPWDSYDISVELAAVWNAPGMYTVTSLEYIYDGALEYGYGFASNLVTGDMIDPWPYIDNYLPYNFTKKINLIQCSHRKSYPEPSEITPSADSGLRIKSGVYRWDDEDSDDYATLIFFDNRSLFYNMHRENNSLLGMIKNTARPSRYFTSQSTDGENIEIRAFMRKNITSIGVIQNITDTEMVISGRTFKLISENLPDDEELEKVNSSYIFK